MGEERPLGTIQDFFAQAAKSNDFHQIYVAEGDDFIRISYFSTLSDEEKITRFLLPALQRNRHLIRRPEQLQDILPFADLQITTDDKKAVSLLTAGYILIQLKEAERDFILVNAANGKLGHRSNNNTENEFSVVGPKSGFVENIDVNLHLLRQQLPVPELVLEEMTLGTLSKTKVVMAYLDNVANPDYVQTMRQRIQDINFEIVFDTSQIDQIIADNSNSPFPLFLSTERVDRVAYAITSGEVAVFSNGSPYVITGPSNFLEFFISPEDYYLPWVLGSFFRFIRIMCVLFSVFGTSIYVAVLTYHFEVIPESMLGPLIKSRLNVPFPPVIEVLFLETTIELLREAGARLPTKIGQTLGIVGGIVIGEASVQAALTSNVLLIIVALAALASFTTPIFKMANTIRLIRFPFIILSGIWGGFGILAGLFILLGHLLRLKSLGMPYFVPLYPFRTGNLNDSLFRASYQYLTNRSLFLRPLTSKRYFPGRKREGENDE